MAQGSSKGTTKKKVVKNAKGKSKAKSKAHHKASRHNQKVLMRWIALIAALIVIILIGVRCSKGSGADAQAEAEPIAVDESAAHVEFSKKGALTVTYVESFDKSYYDEAELQSQIDSEIAAYNEENGVRVSQESLTVEGGTATLVMSYDSAEDYQSFNDQEMFWGTLEEAENHGYDLSGLSGQTNATDETETFGEGTARELAENTVVVITEPLNVVTATDILYASDNLTIANSDYAIVNGTIGESEPAILILARK